MTEINLNAVEFTRAETVLVRHGALTASAFRYASGVAAVRIVNKAGEIILLPFHGQQVWDATFHGRRLTMRSMFDDPVDTHEYLGNYGAFLVHCGVAAMGNPGPGDTHALHGEIPNARYQQASLNLGSDADGPYMELTGTYRHTVAFTHNHLALPSLRMREGDGRLNLNFRVKNLKQSPMDVMYLAHVNFKPVDNGRIIDTGSDDPAHVRIRTKIPGIFPPTPAHAALIDQLLAKPALHRDMVPGRAIDPELVMGLDFKADASGYAHSMQLLPDGSADFISHKPAELPRGVRWITRTANQDALGLYLPATAEADGYTAEKAKGNVITLPPGGEYSCTLHFGALTLTEAKKLEAQINAIKS